jgi:hypothetical protein
MGRPWKILNNWSLLTIFLTFLTVFGSFISPSFGEDLRNVRYGLSIFGGAGDPFHSKTDLTVYGVLPRVDVSLHRN